MKKSKDKVIIPDTIYYYLLSWNEEDCWNTIQIMFDCKRLADLNKDQIASLFEVASKRDLEALRAR